MAGIATATSADRALRRERWAWYWYDFGNSAYASVVLLAVYAAYFKGQVVGGHEGTRLWGLSVGIAMLAVAVISPVLGAIADYSASKKRFLFGFTALACLCTCLLFFVGQGDVALGMILFILAEIGYRASQVFYNALLPDIATVEEMPRISGIGWAVGSAGGVAVLLLILPPIALVDSLWVVRGSLLFTGLFFAAFSLPVFLRLREKGQHRPLPEGSNYLTLAFGRLWRTLRHARQFREFVKFMISFIIYEDGVIMALDFAAIIGAVLFGMNQQMLILFVILVNLTNVAGAYVFGLLAEHWSCKRSLLLSLAMMIAVVLWMFFAHSMAIFFVIGGLAGFAMAGLQSVSRTMVSVVSPPGQTTEFYGFFSVAGRTSSFVGPAVYGLIAAEAAIWYQGRGMAALPAEQQGQRLAILSIAAFLFVGMMVLLTVNERRAREAALQAVAQEAA